MCNIIENCTYAYILIDHFLFFYCKSNFLRQLFLIFIKAEILSSLRKEKKIHSIFSSMINGRIWEREKGWKGIFLELVVSKHMAYGGDGFSLTGIFTSSALVVTCLSFGNYQRTPKNAYYVVGWYWAEIFCFIETIETGKVVTCISDICYFCNSLVQLHI